MKSLVKTISIFLLSVVPIIITPANVFAKSEEFVLGLWHCWNSGCVGGRNIECCLNELWGEETIPIDEQELLTDINANTLHSFYYGLEDANPVMNYCNSVKGAVKMYIGGEARYEEFVGYTEFSGWSGSADSCNFLWWQQGIGKTLALYDTLFNYFGQSGLRGFSITHEISLTNNFKERYGAIYHGLQIMIDSVKNHNPDPNLKFTMVDGVHRNYFPDLLDSIPDLDYFEDEYYLFGLSIDEFTGTTFQSYIDILFNRYANDDWETFKGSNTQWMPVIWAGAMASSGVHMCGDTSMTILKYRWPTREEIRLQAFLALATGARGIVLFSYATVEDACGKIWGLLEYDRTLPTCTIPQNHDDYLKAPYTRYFENYDGIPYDHVKELYKDLEEWGPHFLTLWVDQHYARTDNLPDSSDILRAVSGNYIAGTTMTDTSKCKKPRYFMLVNRVTSNCNGYGCVANPQTITVDFRMPAISNVCILTSVFDRKRKIFTKSDSVVNGYNYYHFEDTIGPGDGKLYKIRSKTNNSSINDQEQIPTQFNLAQNYPNPFNATTIISYSLPQTSQVTLRIYNLLGQHVTTLFEGTQLAGKHNVTWTINNVPSGVYFALLNTETNFEKIKMVLLK